MIARQLGFWSAVATTAIGAVYFVVIATSAATGGLTFPPSGPLQLFGAVTTLLLAPLLLILAVSLRQTARASRKALGDLGLVGVVLFAGMVSINRFVQLSVVRQATADGSADDVARFLPYDDGSVMFALELLGWGWFLGLAAFAFAALFDGSGLERAIRWSFVIYGILGVTSALGYIAASPVAAIGFVAWGGVLYVASGLVAVWFWRRPTARRRTRSLASGSSGDFSWKKWITALFPTASDDYSCPRRPPLPDRERTADVSSSRK